ncbi:hypothetical protein L2755_21755 [Shewanella abyssi]|uniref:hypothetical protein n=1 Tax=Shewanella abyssi TaxID=311789 RepID=UPI00200EA1F5|nr:hypothetical protein [Shewanella abyssi]MCL1052220.1 hypothetical protein [Shewanella abyssi]
MNLFKNISTIAILVFSSFTVAEGNASNYSFSKAKKMLERQVYQDHRETIYCGAKFIQRRKLKP